jgi:hypothetical protein
MKKGRREDPGKREGRREKHGSNHIHPGLVCSNGHAEEPLN